MDLNDVELKHKEEHQQKHYFYLNQLQEMARELPQKFQQRLPYDILTLLADVLINGQVFEIVSGLKEVQELEERSLFNQRIQLINEQRTQKQLLVKKHKDLLQSNANLAHRLPYIQADIKQELEELEKKYMDELKKKDIKVIQELDQKTIDQQNLLEKVGIPGFFITNNPLDIRLQMYLLELILRLEKIKFPNGQI